MLRNLSFVLLVSLLLIMGGIVGLSYIADGQRAEQAGFFERAGIAADQLLETASDE